MSTRNVSGSPDVAVIGGGAIGVSVALELARNGASVSVLERGPEVAWECSAGNAGIVGAAHVVPLAGPAVLWEGLRSLPSRDSPFGMRPRPGLAPWLARFLAASTPRRVHRAHSALRELALESAALHAELAEDGLNTGFARHGLLNVYGSEEAFRAARRGADADRSDGLPSQALDASQVREQLAYIASSAAGAIFYPDEAHCDPQLFVSALAEQAELAGARISTGVEVLEIRRRGARVTELWTNRGAIRAGQVVLAAGTHSPRLIRDLGFPLPVEGGKGYHVEVDAYGGDPQMPVWFQEQRVVVTRLAGRLRVAGTLELTGTDATVNPRRVTSVVAAAERGLRSFRAREIRRVWRGLRPCTPDGLPIIGRPPRLHNLLLATGHGMWGLQLAPVTGRIVAELACGAVGRRELEPFSPSRFVRRRAFRVGRAGPESPPRGGSCPRLDRAEPPSHRTEVSMGGS